MFPIIESFLQERQTQRAFCEEHGLSRSVLGYWLAKYHREMTERPGAFLEITPAALPQVQAVPPAEQALMEVVYPHGVRLRLFSPVAPAFLEHLLMLEGAAEDRTA